MRCCRADLRCPSHPKIWPAGEVNAWWDIKLTSGNVWSLGAWQRKESRWDLTGWGAEVRAWCLLHFILTGLLLTMSSVFPKPGCPVKEVANRQFASSPSPAMPSWDQMWFPHLSQLLTWPWKKAHRAISAQQITSSSAMDPSKPVFCQCRFDFKFRPLCDWIFSSALLPEHDCTGDICTLMFSVYSKIS